jgi:hypothetical protein
MSFVALVILQASIIDLVLLGVATSRRLERFKEIAKVARCSCETCCAHLAGAVKSNSSGIEVWRG